MGIYILANRTAGNFSKRYALMTHSCRPLGLRIVAVVACAPSPQVSVVVNGHLLRAVAAVEELHRVRMSSDPTRAPISDSMHVWFA